MIMRIKGLGLRNYFRFSGFLCVPEAVYPSYTIADKYSRKYKSSESLYLVSERVVESRT